MNFRRSNCRTLLLLAVASAGARGVSPASAPSTSAKRPLDLSTPKAAVLSLYAALRAGDLPAARRCLRFKSGRQEETFDLCVTPLWMPLQLMHAMEARFGPAARRPFSCALLEKAVDQALHDLDRAQVTASDDTAVIAEKIAAGDPNAETEVTGITLRRRGNQWLIDPETFPGMTGEIPPAQIPMMRSLRNAVVSACNSTLERLEKSGFKSANEAFLAYQSSLQAEALKQHP